LLNCPAFFRNPEFSRDLYDPQSGEFLSYAGILHSLMSEDISEIFRRFYLVKKSKSVRRVGLNLGSTGWQSSPLPLHHNYLNTYNKKEQNIIIKDKRLSIKNR
jgi:hypothetical protein